MRPPARPRPRRRPSPAPAPRPQQPPVVRPEHRETPVTSAALRAPAGPSRTAPSRAPTIPVRPAVVSTASAERFAERVRARRRVARVKLVGAVAVVLVVLGAGWLVGWSPVFGLDPDDVQVVGAGTVVDPATVHEVVDGLAAGVPLPRLDGEAIRAAVLEVPGVRDVQVHRAWPRGLVITLMSREPVAAVPSGKRFVLLDIEGVQVGTVEELPAGLPEITIPLDARNDRTVAAVLAVLDELPADLVQEVESVSAGSQDTVSMRLRDGARVEWGSGQDTALKVAVLQALRSSEAGAKARVFDVSAPTMPITR